MLKESSPSRWRLRCLMLAIWICPHPSERICRRKRKTSIARVVYQFDARSVRAAISS